jgi:hypothetical protein
MVEKAHVTCLKDFVKNIMCHTTPKIRDMKFMLYYRMNFNDALKNLMLRLTSFFQSQCINLVKSQLNTRKIVAIVLYKFLHGINATHKG